MNETRLTRSNKFPAFQQGIIASSEPTSDLESALDLEEESKADLEGKGKGKGKQAAEDQSMSDSEEPLFSSVRTSDKG